MPTPKNRLGRATERYQGKLSGAYDRWVRELNPILKKAIRQNIPLQSTMSLVDDAIEILLDTLFDINRDAMLSAYKMGYGRAPDKKGMAEIEKSTDGFRESLETHMGPKVRSDIEGFLKAQHDRKASFTSDIAEYYTKPLSFNSDLRSFAIDPLSLVNSLGPQKSELLSGGGGYWAMAFQGAGDKMGLIDKNRSDQDLPKIKVKWVLDPGADHCEASGGHYGCPDLAGTYDSWDDLPTVPAGDVTCRGNCRCEIKIIEGKRDVDPIGIPAPRPKQTDPLAAAARIIKRRKAPAPVPVIEPEIEGVVAQFSMRVNEVKAPDSYDMYTRPYIFLAGSIEMGSAENWQKQVVDGLSNGTILNPRRDNWDSTWEQSISHPRFREQVEWELKGQEDADLILMHFDPATKSPITLLELGLFYQHKMIVHCPDGYWRKGNVDIVCKRYGIPMVDTIETMIGAANYVMNGVIAL